MHRKNSNSFPNSGKGKEKQGSFLINSCLPVPSNGKSKGNGTKGFKGWKGGGKGYAQWGTDNQKGSGKGGSQGVQGYCNICRQWGHKAVNCPQGRSRGNGNTNGVMNKCRMRHKTIRKEHTNTKQNYVTFYMAGLCILMLNVQYKLNTT